MFPPRPAAPTPADCLLPLSILSSYLFFLLRRPISGSNSHYLAQRIRGLQSLAFELESTNAGDLHAIARSLRSLEPANFARVARDLQFRLALVHQPPAVPADYVISHHPPARASLSGVNRLLMVLGPAIGIGDEMILFPVPRRIRQISPDVEVTVMSGYRGLWDRVADVHRREYYSTHLALVEALRGAARAGFDAVLWADFEKPGLITAVCREPDLPLYVELSLGGQCAAVVDRRLGEIHSVTLPAEAWLNYYEALDALLDWLGMDTPSLDRYDRTVSRTVSAAPPPLRVFVSPFTSKYEPSVLYWSNLLAAVSDCDVGDLEFCADAGASLSTERFASAVVRSAAAHAPGRRFTLSTDLHGRTLSLASVFRQLERCHVVLCADSYAAHAGPLFGCATVVVARAGVENWRTPFERSFYFDLEQPVADVAASIGRLFEWVAGASAPMPSIAAIGLHEATVELRRLLTGGAVSNGVEVDDAYSRFTASYAAVLRDLPHWPRAYTALLGDVDYDRSWRSFEPSGRRSGAATLARLGIELARWERTNLRKALALAAAGEVR